MCEVGEFFFLDCFTYIGDKETVLVVSGRKRLNEIK